MGTAQIRKREPVGERLTVRLPRSCRSIVERAAAINGTSINQFIVQSAVERANKVLQSMEKVQFSLRDAQVFMDALSNPPKPNNKLLEAVHAHDRLIESRDCDGLPIFSCLKSHVP